jgi:hypothetical protein
MKEQLVAAEDATEADGVEIEAELVEAPEVGYVPDPSFVEDDPAKLAAVAELVSKGFTESTARLMIGLSPL